MLRYHRANPTIYYIIGAVAAGIFAVHSVVALSHQIAAAWNNRKVVSESSVVSEPVESEEEEEEDEPWKLLLVNYETKLPDGYERKLEFTKLRGDIWVDERIYPELQQMMNDCRAEGLKPIVCSGYRSTTKQTQLFNTEVRKYMRQGYTEENAIKETEKLQAHPGYSEHHTGMAVDIMPESNQYPSKEQEESGEIKWLMANCYKYGFILRYPEDKVDITHINYEPWHYRYVGKKAAKYITEHNLCLEEYLQETGITQATQTTQTTAAGTD